MKRMFITFIVMAILLAAAAAQAMDIAAAARLHAETGIDGICLNTEDGRVPFAESVSPQSWYAVKAKYVYTDSAAEAMVLETADGDIYTFYVAANQRSIAPCVANSKTLYLYIQDGYISATGCLAYE